jgi:hypothetical protein
MNVYKLQTVCHKIYNIRYKTYKPPIFSVMVFLYGGNNDDGDDVDDGDQV